MKIDSSFAGFDRAHQYHTKRERKERLQANNMHHFFLFYRIINGFDVNSLISCNRFILFFYSFVPVDRKQHSHTNTHTPSNWKPHRAFERITNIQIIWNGSWQRNYRFICISYELSDRFACVFISMWKHKLFTTQTYTTHPIIGRGKSASNDRTCILRM